ncbi:hypothetical protein CHS0354_000520 [Potamilus streckersoni]|uniref:Hydrogenase n=1 Tax=Potamilus streckersoni TaxID=2493646 RepID=A0AAE0W7E3_9BIVA|nr:hypothetical protein CHS0354_000520 [Potamilus streckersoni]
MIEANTGIAQVKEQKSEIDSPDAAIAELKAGNQRFLDGKLKNTNYKKQIEETKADQHPHSVVLSCLDSRVPPEIIFDQGIGNIFVARVAGNIEDPNILGSMEFATKIKGTKLIVVMGHTKCGAVKGAIDGAELGHLTHLVDQIKPAITGDPKNKDAMLDETAKKNVKRTINDILNTSSIISMLNTEKKVKIVGAYYDLATVWLQGGACSGNTMSFLNAQEPTVVELIVDFGINILWHPTVGLEIGDQVGNLLNSCVAGKTPLDIFVFEGTVVEGPNKSGTMNYFADRPMKDWVKDLAGVAQFVVAIGDCATYGGIPAVPPNPSESTGMQFLKKKKGGFLGEHFKAKSGLPVINIPGCPAHPDWITQILVAIATGRAGDILIDEYHRPKTFFSTYVQSGCTKVNSFANKIEGGFGKRGGCLFYEVGCRGPMTKASCNNILWNRWSSKTRSNHPCLGCTEPGFPHHDLAPGTVFHTMKYLGVFPKEVPDGDNKLGYYLKAGLETVFSNSKVAEISK